MQLCSLDYRRVYIDFFFIFALRVKCQRNLILIIYSLAYPSMFFLPVKEIKYRVIIMKVDPEKLKIWEEFFFDNNWEKKKEKVSRENVVQPYDGALWYLIFEWFLPKNEAAKIKLKWTCRLFLERFIVFSCFLFYAGCFRNGFYPFLFLRIFLVVYLQLFFFF